MSETNQTESRFPVKLTLPQRKVVAEVLPELTERLKLSEEDQRTISFTLAELKSIKDRVQRAKQHATSGMKRNSLRHVADLTAQAIETSQGIGQIPVSVRLYQFKITLKGITPPIWRRIQVRDSDLDKFHERIQTAMGWTNSHLHHFRIGKQLYGDPELLGENFDEMNYEDSMMTNLSDIVPKSGKRCVFEYEYDFGDCWEHEIIFEGCVRAKPKRGYPLCLDGQRKCPPEDVGGTWGYADFLDAINNPDHERHAEVRRWIGAKFESEEFDAGTVTKRMKRGLPDWRRMM